jgi:hypothetical protein
MRSAWQQRLRYRAHLKLKLTLSKELNDAN